MNLVANRTLYPQLREDEALVVENAIRLAIDSIINVLYGVNSARTNEYQRMVGDRDKEIQRLERRLQDVERELRAPRQQGCSCRMQETAPVTNGLTGAPVPCDPQEEEEEEDRESVPGCHNTEMTAVSQGCEMSK